MRILVCNDDGIEAPGLRSSPKRHASISGRRVGRRAGPEMDRGRASAVVRPRSHAHAHGGAHVCLLGRAGRLRRRRDDGAVRGQPRPDLVLAGVNDKRNVGEDLAYSGTMAIAREAVFWGVAAIAVSGDGRAGADPCDRDSRDCSRPRGTRAPTGQATGAGSASTCRQRCPRRSKRRASDATRSRARATSSNGPTIASCTGLAARTIRVRASPGDENALHRRRQRRCRAPPMALRRLPCPTACSRR